MIETNDKNKNFEINPGDRFEVVKERPLNKDGNIHLEIGDIWIADDSCRKESGFTHLAKENAKRNRNGYYNDNNEHRIYRNDIIEQYFVRI